MSYRRTRKDLQITLDRINEAFKAKYPHGATFDIVRYSGRGYQVYVRGINHVATFPTGSTTIRQVREMEAFLEGLLAGITL